MQMCVCVTPCECLLPQRWCVSPFWAGRGPRHGSRGLLVSLSASVSLDSGRMLVRRIVLLLLKIEEILKSAGREEDKYSISVFLPILLFSTAFHFLRWIFILPTSTEDNCIPFLSDWPSYHFMYLLLLFFSFSKTFVQGHIRWS